MSLLVVDASVAVKWLVPEVHSDAALALLEADHTLIAPDLLSAEVGNILWKKRRLGELSVEESEHALEVFTRKPIEIVPTDALVTDALGIANRHDRTVYDSLYLALAEGSEATMVTADQKLVNALAGSELAPHILWVGDLG